MYKLASFAVPAIVVAALLALAPLAFAQSVSVGSDGSSYPTYGDDARWSNSTDTGATVCTMDAMQCPDGSYVGRSGPNCEFVCPAGGTTMPDPTHGYGKNGFPDGGDTNYSGGPSDTVTVGADGSVSSGGMPTDCGENGKLCPDYIGDNGGTNNWWDPCQFTNWIWINPCTTETTWGISSDNNDGDTVQNAYLSGSPTYGSAPLSVSFNASGLSSGSQYIIDFGDGQNSGPISATGPSCPPNPDMGAPCMIGGSLSTEHTYVTSGTYTAILEPYAACMWSNPRCLMATQPLGSVNITVTGSSNNGNVCAADAMQCPDGSYVGRSGPNCEFVCPAGGTTMPDPTHGYGKNGFPDGGDTNYSGGPSDTVTVDANGSVNTQGAGFWHNMFSFFGF